jgi:hypothetical protein
LEREIRRRAEMRAVPGKHEFWSAESSSRTCTQFSERCAATTYVPGTQNGRSQKSKNPERQTFLEKARPHNASKMIGLSWQARKLDEKQPVKGALNYPLAVSPPRRPANPEDYRNIASS